MYYIDYYCQSLRLQILFEQVDTKNKYNLIRNYNFYFFQAHRIRSQGTKQKDLQISDYSPCKSFTIEYWKEYNANVINYQQKKQIIYGKNIGIQKFYVSF